MRDMFLKKNNFLAILSLFLFSECNNNHKLKFSYDIEENQDGNITNIIQKKNHLKNGQMFSYENEVLTHIFHFKNDKPNGYWYYYNIDGKLIKKEYYEDGIVQGDNISYFENGKISSYLFYNQSGVPVMNKTYDSATEKVNTFLDCDHSILNLFNHPNEFNKGDTLEGEIFIIRPPELTKFKISVCLTKKERYDLFDNNDIIDSIKLATNQFKFKYNRRLNIDSGKYYIHIITEFRDPINGNRLEDKVLAIYINDNTI
jgi:hypothetical protein